MPNGSQNRRAARLARFGLKAVSVTANPTASAVNQNARQAAPDGTSGPGSTAFIRFSARRMTTARKRSFSCACGSAANSTALASASFNSGFRDSTSIAVACGVWASRHAGTTRRNTMAPATANVRTNAIARTADGMFHRTSETPAVTMPSSTTATARNSPRASRETRRARPTSDKRSESGNGPSVGGRKTNAILTPSDSHSDHTSRSRRRYHHSATNRSNMSVKLPAWLHSGTGGHG